MLALAGYDWPDDPFDGPDEAREEDASPVDQLAAVERLRSAMIMTGVARDEL
jgi:hypothetical protein